MASLPFVAQTGGLSALELCLGDLQINNLTEPVLKFIHFKAKCHMNRLKDKLEWEDYCLKNNIILPQTAPTETKHPTTQSKVTQTEQSIRLKTNEKLPITRKSVSIQTSNVKNKNVQVKMKETPRHNNRLTKESQSEKVENFKPVIGADRLKMSPTMLKLENQVFEELINDVKCEMETIAWKNKLEETKIKENKLKAIRKQIRKLEEQSETSISLKSEDSSRSSSETVKQLCISIDDEKLKRILQHNSQVHQMSLKLPPELFDQLADDLLQEKLQSITQEVVEIVDYIAAVSYQEEVELF